MKAKGKVLLYNMEAERGRSVRMLCIRHGLRIINVAPESYGLTIGELAGKAAPSDEARDEKRDEANDESPDEARSESMGDTHGQSREDAAPFTDEMMVMCDLPKNVFDSFLASFRKAGIETVALKAVLTETNSKWDSVSLHDELVRERKAVMESLNNQK